MTGLKMRDKLEILDKINEAMASPEYWIEPKVGGIDEFVLMANIDLEARVEALCWVLNLEVKTAKKMYEESGKVALP